MAKEFGICGEIGSAVPKLAPDLTYPGDKSTGANLKAVTGIDGSAGLTTALSLVGKFEISYLAFQSMTAENVTIKLTIDGVIIWNSTFANVDTGTSSFLGLDNTSGNSFVSDVVISCDTSFLLEIATTADNSVTLKYLARPIL